MKKCIIMMWLGKETYFESPEDRVAILDHQSLPHPPLLTMPMPTAEDDERARDGATFRWAIAGSGLIAADFAYALSVTPGATLVAVAARTTERAAAFAASASVLPGAVAKANAAAAAAGGPAVTASTIRTYGSYAELAADANVDVVYVATTNPQHVPVASLFVEVRRIRSPLSPSLSLSLACDAPKQDE